MASFPNNKVHRTNRRKLGKGQHVQVPPTAVAATASTDTVVLTFAAPVIVSGPTALTVATLTQVSTTQISPTVVHVLMSGALSSHAYNLPAGDPNISNFQGGSNAGTSGTF